MFASGEMKNAQLDALVSKFVADLEVLVRQNAVASMQQVLGALGESTRVVPSSNGGEVAKRGPGRPRKVDPGTGLVKVTGNIVSVGPGRPKGRPGKLGKNGRRSPAEIEATANKILSYVKSHPGSTGEAIKKALGLDKPAWLVPIKTLVESKALVMKGERRAATCTAGK